MEVNPEDAVLIIADRLNAFLKNQNMSAREFERNIGVSVSTVSRFIAKKSQINLQTLLKITSGYPSINIQWLLFGDEGINSFSNVYARSVSSLPNGNLAIVFEIKESTIKLTIAKDESLNLLQMIKECLQQ